MRAVRARRFVATLVAAAACSAAAAGTARGQTPFTGTYTFTAATGTTNPFPYNGPDIANLTEGALTRGSGLTVQSNSGNFSATGWSTTTLDATDYFAFTLSADASYTLSMTSITFGIGNTNTGPRKWEWRSSLDDYGSAITTYSATNAGLTLAAGVLTSGTNISLTGNVLDVSAPTYSNLSTITFRMYAYDAGGSTGGGRLQGPLSFAGSLASSLASGNHWAPSAGGGGSGTWTTSGSTWAMSAGTQGSNVQSGTSALVFGDAAGTVTVGGNVSIAAGMRVSTSGYLFSGGTISLAGATAGSNTITLDTGISGTIASVLAGSVGMTKAGAGTLVLSGSNACTGVTTVAAGQLVTAAAGAISTDVTVSSGAALVLGAAQTFTGLAGTGTLAAGGNPLTFSIAGSSTFAGTLTGDASSSLTKIGTGTMTFTGSTSGYAGTVTVNQGAITGLSFGSGTVALDGGSALGDAGGTITNSFVIGGPAASAFSGSWGFGVTAGDLAVTAVAGAGMSFGSVTQGNNNGTTAVSGNSTPSSDYPGASGNFNVQAAARTGSLATGTGGSAYFEFSVTGSAGYSFDVSSVTFGSRSTSSGPVEFSLRADTAGTYGTSLGSASGLANLTWALESIAVTGTTSSGTIVYRIYGYGSGTTASQNTANWRIDDLSVSGTSYAATRPSSTGTLGIAGTGAVTYTGNVVVTGTATLAAVSGGTATFTGVIGGAQGAVTKTGLGVVALSGSTSYAGPTAVSQGTLTVLAGGRLAGTSAVSVAAGAHLRTLGEIGASGSSTPVTVNGMLSGNGRLFGTVGGSGSIDPGNSPGIVTLTSIDPSAGLDHNFEFTATAPVYATSGTGALNDIVHVTGATPFTAPLSASGGNGVNVYFNAGSFTEGTTYVGGFFVDGAADLSDFLADVSAAQFTFFVADAVLGGVTYEGVGYLALADWNSTYSRNLSVDVGGLFVANAGFDTGTTSGYVTTFAIVPEPSALAVAGLGLIAVWAARRRTAAGRPLPCLPRRRVVA